MATQPVGLRYLAVMPNHLETLIQQGIADGEHLGAQVFASVHGEARIDAAYGESRPGVPLTTDSVMLWMSAGKPVTAIGIAQQVAAGRIGLDSPVSEYLPGFEQNGKGGITVRHVLTHTGGFRAAKTEYPRDSWEQAVQAVCEARLEPGWVPGQRAGYHVHTGWTVLGRLIEIASGEAFPEYTRQHIFDPLGMQDCWAGMPRPVYRELGSRLAVMHDTSGAEPRDAQLSTEDWCAGVRPGGNAYGPAKQLGRFYEMLLELDGAGRGGAGSLDGATVLSPEVVALFTSRQREGMEDRTFRHVMDWSLGLMLDSKRHLPTDERGTAIIPYGYGPHASDPTFGHGGNQCAAAFADPTRGLAAAVLFNGMPGEDRHQRRVYTVLTALYADLGLVG